MCGSVGNAADSPSGRSSSVVTASTNVAISSSVTPRSIVTRSTPSSFSRRLTAPRFSALEIGVSSTMISSPTIPITMAGSSAWSGCTAADSAAMFRTMIGWLFEYS